jgi:type I restriction enzyme, S subunit
MREDWIECTFKEITLSLKRGPFGGDLKKSFFVESGFPVYEQQHAINDDYSNIRYFIDDERFEKLKACNVGPGDYIVSCSGTMGKISRIPNNVPKGVINQALLRIRLNDEIMLHNYFIQYFKSSLFQKKILKDSRGSGMQNMAGIKELKPIPNSIPPLVEQKAIVKKIEELFSSLDSGIADLKKAQDQLVIYRQAVLKKAFEGELTKDWREKQTNLPSADELLEQIKEERQKHYDQQLADWKEAVKAWEENGKGGKKPTKPKKIKLIESWTEDEMRGLFVIAKKWKWIRIIQTVFDTNDDIVDGPFGSNLKNSDFTEDGTVPVIGISNIDEGFKTKIRYVTDEKFQTISRSAVYPGNIIVAKIGSSYGKTGLYPEWMPVGLIPANLLRIRPSHHFNKTLLVLYLKSLVFKRKLDKIMKSTAQPAYNVSAFKNLPIPFMSIEEQHQIVQEIESRLSVCDKVEKDIVDSLEKAQALRQSILKKAFEGKLLSEKEIAACKTHKDYQPASVLLEKIKAEKIKK